jgi:Flp pilus assembly protein TadG
MTDKALLDASPRTARPDGSDGRIGLLARARRVLRLRRGTTAVEFALIAGPFMTLILGTCEIAWQLATSAALDHAALKASRFGATGSNSIPDWQRAGTAPEDMPSCRTAGIRWLVPSSTGNLIRDNANLTVTTATWSNLGTITGAGAENPGGSSQITEYTIRYMQPFISGPIAASLWGGAGFTHQSRIVIKNEPFDTTNC